MPFNAIVFPSDAHKTPEKNAKQTRKCALHFMYMRLSSNVMSYNNRTGESKRESIKAMTDGIKPKKENMIVLLLYRCITSYCFGRITKWLRPKRSGTNIESDDFLERIFIILMEVRLLLILLMLGSFNFVFAQCYNAWWKCIPCYFKLQASCEKTKFCHLILRNRYKVCKMTFFFVARTYNRNCRSTQSRNLHPTMRHCSCYHPLLHQFAA